MDLLSGHRHLATAGLGAVAVVIALLGVFLAFFSAGIKDLGAEFADLMSRAVDPE